MIPANVSSVTVQVSIRDDSIVENMENFNANLTLSVSSLGVVLGVSSAVVTIIDDDCE